MAEQAMQDVDVETDGVDTEIEIEGPSDTDTDNDSGAEDQFQRAESSTQKRIDRLTKKMREAQRREQEAIRYAQAVQHEATSLKNRMNALDTSYVSEYSNRVTSQMQQAEQELARAIEMGDSAATVEAQRKVTALAIQADRANQTKMQQERARQQQEAAAQQAAAAQRYAASNPMPAQTPKRPDPKAEQWALRNSWFGQDEAMTYAAFGIHKTLVEDEGFDPQSDDYYNELDRRISDKFGRGSNSPSRRPAQTVAGANRTVSGRSGKKVRLTPSQVAIAKKLGVPLEEYAKYVKE
jgi:hypothetical protein